MSMMPSAEMRHEPVTPLPAKRPQWLDAHLYPFQSHFVDVESHRIHYIDEGSGPIVLFVHPGLGWSFIYSEIIQDLRSRFRCIALDLPGFGLSPATPSYQPTLTSTSLLIEQFIQTLGLREVTLFAHDVTGSSGLGVVARRPEWFRAVIIGPSFAWPLESYPTIFPMVKLVGSPLFRFLSVRFNFFLEYSLRTLPKKHKRPLSAQEKQAYRGPNRNHAVRRYPHDLFRSAARSHDYLADLEQRLRAMREVPALLLFGDTDGAIKLGWLARLEGIFPRHRSIIMKGCHHFPQIYDSPGVAAAIRAWWDEEIEPVSRS